MGEKLDLKKVDKRYYAGKVGQWDPLTIPALSFLRIQGQGDPGGPTYARAMSALYPIAYALKFAQKALGADFVVPPQQSLWWAADPGVFARGERAKWHWAAMIRMPDSVDEAAFEAAREHAGTKVAKKGGDITALQEVRLVEMLEGTCLQTLHVGPYTDEAPVLAHLHEVIMPEAGLTFNGPHHEIYLSDPRRVATEKLRTILRQPVKNIGTTTG